MYLNCIMSCHGTSIEVVCDWYIKYTTLTGTTRFNSVTSIATAIDVNGTPIILEFTTVFTIPHNAAQPMQKFDLPGI